MSSSRPTFPLDRSRVFREKWKRIFGSPVTWAPLLPVMGSYTFLDVPLWGVLGLACGVAGGLFVYWRKRMVEEEQTITRKMVTESNVIQDRELLADQETLERDGFRDYARSLLGVIHLKQEIEKEMHGGGEALNDSKKEIEKLVDALCFGVRDQLVKAAAIGVSIGKATSRGDSENQTTLTAKRDSLLTQVERATESLQNTFRDLPKILDPAGQAMVDAGGEASLDIVIERLKEESVIAERVQGRLESQPFPGHGQVSE